MHLLLGAGATVWIVSRAVAPRALAFRGGPPSPNKTQRSLEHQVQVQKRRQRQPPPAAAPPDRRIAVAGLAAVSLPPLPPMPPSPLAAPPRSLLAGMSAAGSLGQPGPLGAGSGGALTQLGAGGSAGAGGPGLNFFGIREAMVKSVVIMIDVSDSMFTRTGDAQGRKLLKFGAEQSFQTVRNEAIKLVRSLPAATRFNIVRWSGGAYGWLPESVPATEANKTAAVAHIQEEVDCHTARPRDGRPGGTRHDYALELAFALRPEVIYLLTDGNATAAQPGGGLHAIPAEDIWNAAEAGQKGLGPKRARLHVVYYLTGADKEGERAMLTTLAERNGGQFRSVEAPGRRARGR